MNFVNGKMILDVNVPVDADSETMGLLEANYRYDKDMVIAWKLVAVDCKGKEHNVMVNMADSVELTEFIEE